MGNINRQQNKLKNHDNNKQIIKSPLFHICFWIFTITFYFISPVIRDAFDFKNREQPQTIYNLPALTDEGKIYIDGLDPISRDQVEYKLWGWAFLFIDKEFTPDDYTRTLVLESQSGIFTYAVTSIPRIGVHETFSDYGLDLINSGFVTYISSQDIPNDIYHISMKFESKNNATSFLLRSNKRLEKSHNFFLLR